MADTKTTAETENTAPLGSDLLYMVDDPAGTPTSNKIYMGSLNMLPDGYMINGKLSVTVTSNNITVALKTRSGGNPSTTDPVSVYINGTLRRCTASLSVTKNAGTQWFALGSAFAALEQDFFVYLIWNTTPGTDIMDIGFARIPYGRVYSDFSSTTTNEKYLAFANASTPTSTDDCVVIGRFGATLSAAASYNWSVPTFTNSNLWHTPIYETRWLAWAPTYAAGGSMTFTTVTTDLAQYRLNSTALELELEAHGTTGGSASAYITATPPITLSVGSGTPVFACSVQDTASVITGSGQFNASTLFFFRYDAANFGLGANRYILGTVNARVG